MKKFGKKIAAMGAAVMMAVSMMSVNVSAYNNNFDLKYEPYGTNVLEKTVTSQSTLSGKTRIRTSINTLTRCDLKAQGYAYARGHMNLYISKTYTSTTPSPDTVEALDTDIHIGTDVKTVAKLIKDSPYQGARAKGTIVGF